MELELTQEHLALMRSEAKFIAIVVRNALEDIHIKYIPDGVMKEFNTILRNSIYTAIYARETQFDSMRSKEYMEYQRSQIPSYWEEPELLEGLKK